MGLSDYVAAKQADLATDEGLRAHLTANAVFNENERQLTLLALGRRLYLDDHARRKAHPLYVSFPTLMERATGLPATALQAIGIAASAYWQTRNARKAHEGAIPLEMKPYFAKTTITPEQIDAFLRVVSDTPEGFQTRVAARYSIGELKPFSFVPFAETPILNLGQRQYCVSYKLLTRRLTTDLHYFFLQYLPEADRKAYLGFHGVAFEDTVHAALHQCTKRPRKAKVTPPQMRYYELDDFRKDDGESLADGLLVSEDTAVILDAKAGRYPAPVLEEDQKSLLRFLETNILKAARQINSTITQLKTRKISPKGFSVDSIRRFVPVAVTLQYIGWNPLLTAHILKRIKDEGLLTDPRCAEMQVAELASLLIVADNEPQHDTTLPALLLRRALDPWYSANSLQNYLVSLGAKLSWATPTLRRELTETYSVAARAMGFSVILPGSSGQ